jgi:hypothetical protein
VSEGEAGSPTGRPATVHAQSAPRSAIRGAACGSVLALRIEADGAAFAAPPVNPTEKECPMFCQKCGTSMADTATACPSCQFPSGAPVPAAMADTVKAAYGSALAALKGFAADPVGRLQPTYAALGDEKARRIGITYGVASVIGFLLGGYLMLPFRDGLLDFLGFGGVMKCVLFGVIPFAGLAAGSMAARKVLGGQGGAGGDLFVAGAALLPVTLAMVVNGLLGYEHAGAMGLVSILAGTTAVLMLFAGYSRISRLSERATTLAIPIVVVLTLWLGKTIAGSVLEGGLSGGRMGGMGGGFGNSGGLAGWNGY